MTERKKRIKKIVGDADAAFDAIARDPTVRNTVASESHLLFFHLYFSHYVKYPIAEFQKDIFRITEDQSNKLACIVAFRGSGKSTLVTLSYALWAILGVQRKKFVLIACRTQAQARQHMINIRRELENNILLKSDMGPFQEDAGGEWAMSSIVFSNTNARITVASVDQSIRGIRHYQHRPDVIILDDVEDINSARTLEGRNDIFNWFTREIVPLGDMGTRIILVGNLLHEDSLMMRLHKRIKGGELRGDFRWFPLVDDRGACLWPGKFDSPEKIEDLRRSVANELAWQQEYLLRIISDDTKVIFSEWINSYDRIPEAGLGDRPENVSGVDLGISDKESADCTAMVSAEVRGHGRDMKIYVLPNPLNKRMLLPEIMESIKSRHRVLETKLRHSLFMENVQAQDYLVQFLRAEGLPVQGVNPGRLDKRTRLALTSEAIRTGTVLFPRHGAETLIAQLTGFGVERHDDLADAFTMMVMKTLDTRPQHSSFAPFMGGESICGDLRNKKF